MREINATPRSPNFSACQGKLSNAPGLFRAPKRTSHVCVCVGVLARRKWSDLHNNNYKTPRSALSEAMGRGPRGAFLRTLSTQNAEIMDETTQHVCGRSRPILPCPNYVLGVRRANKRQSGTDEGQFAGRPDTCSYQTPAPPSAPFALHKAYTTGVDKIPTLIWNAAHSTRARASRSSRRLLHQLRQLRG